jgi:2-oxoisovalerate dehydrogenase E2 component (dihydrolipoyl transacylase)
MMILVKNRALLGLVASKSLHKQFPVRPILRSLSSTVAFKLADIGEGITEVELLQWFVKEGDSVKSFDRICEVQSDKATVEITSRYDGSVAKLHYKVGDVMKVGKPIVDIRRETDGDQSKLINQDSSATILSVPSVPIIVHGSTSKGDENIKSESGISTSSSSSSSREREVFAAPAVRKLAKENGVDLSSVIATG